MMTTPMFTPEREKVRSIIWMLTRTERMQLRNCQPVAAHPRAVYWSSRSHIHRKLRAAGLVQRILLGDPSGAGFVHVTPLGMDVVRELERTGA